MLVELSVMEQRYQAVLEVITSLVPVSEVAERYGVSRQTVHAWLARYEADGLPGLADQSHRSRHRPWQLDADVAAQICDLRRSHRKWGPRRLRHELSRSAARADVCGRVRAVRRGIRVNDLDPSVGLTSSPSF